MTMRRPKDDREPARFERDPEPQAPSRQPPNQPVQPDNDGYEPQPPNAVTRQRALVSPFWLVPLLALGLVGYLGFRAFTSHGPTITVTFQTADGLRVEQTQVKHKAVALGTVQRIELSDKADHVIVHIAMDGRAAPMLTDRARFWVVRPRLQGGGIAALQTGLETLVSGSYIEIDPGAERGEPQTEFIGLEQPPAVRSGEPGTTVVLTANEIGSIGAGSVIMHRQMPVGEVLGFDLNQHTGAVSIRAFIREPYDNVIDEDTAFWNVSGLDVGMGASGLHVEVASMRTMFSGGIAFRTPHDRAPSTPVKPGQTFPLYPSQAAAEIALYGPIVPYVAYFRDSILGLSEGSAVRMFGMQVGNVTELGLVKQGPGDAAPLVARVGFVLQPERALTPETGGVLYPKHMREQVARGLRVVLETSSYVTGQKSLSLSYMPEGEGGEVGSEGNVLVLPSHARGFDSMADSLSDVAARLNAIPYEQIGRNLQHTLEGIDRAVSGPQLKQAIERLDGTLAEVGALAREVRSGLSPALARLPAIASHVDEAVANANAALTNMAGNDGDFQRKAQRALTQVEDMARSVRLLANFLERHPEALLRGRDEEER